MPVDAVGAGANPIVDNYTIGANAKAKEDAKTLATTKEMSQAEKEALFLKKMNQGQKTDKAAQTKENPGKLGKDDFMKLLLATLKYQDPTEPMDTAKLLEQTSTMTNMEQMIQMTEASKKSFEAQQRAQGTTMVGKTAVYDAVDAQGNAVTTAGKIDAVEFLADGKVLAHIGKEKVEMSDILGIADPTENSPLDKAISDAVKEGKKPGAAAEPQKTPAAAGAAAAAETTPGQTGATPTPATQTNNQATNTPAPAA
ncbi:MULTISPECIES: flagellar hook assembly protein FlgD [Mobiluncus]|uniref:Basal-body rod modification protein FlgD n=3 Tax=Mobiluncus TaxID=2050 RepID=D6ZKE1_MOBCV|nr:MULTISPECIES: flagellar hook capping FlgD N-terminal domain-containing protein [Mobiluncus]ADI67190.1 flagellar hook capping protein [Mobiluncus curtisii ATCC 43063]EFL93971.1 flagellar hook capping protein [Mobiluncus curtisii subsp. curtisii ATCC 35241]EFU81591.1 flagellar hook capping protein [Mobiluncus holmesii ATCC 35242]MCV0021335.1 flagellar hook capping protein [Mobiluncus curtisii]NMW43588.1 flagellar hook capping protein [Mobiluncus curtisii]